ncbi:MAG: amidohydrolase family protein [Acidimicrobiales bacterium]
MDQQQADWLALYTEEPVDPAQEICDPHHHLWDFPTDRYCLEELRADTGAGHNIVSTVFIECTAGYRADGPEAMRPVGETEFVLAQAIESADTEGSEIKGIVGLADLTLGADVAEVLEAHIEAGGGRFKGIRHATAYDPSPDVRRSHTRPTPGLMGEPSFREGFAQLGRHDLRFDAWLYHPQITELVDLAHAHSDVLIVLDHLGGPLGVGPYAGRRDEVRAEWRRSIIQLAECPNVSVKLGGIGMTVYGLDWHHQPTPPTSDALAEAWGPDIEFCIGQFGVRRSMFESNFPVDRRSTGYTVLWNTFQKLTADYSPDERSALFHDTASAFYDL